MQNSNEGIFGAKFLKDAISKSEIKAFVAANRETLLAPIKKWAQMLKDNLIINEEKFQDSFINTIFKESLGYTRQGDGTPWTCEREYGNQGKSADAVLGYFWKGAHEDDTTFVAIELKSPSTKDLARRPPQKEMSAVEQAHDYASKIGTSCRWVVVSNMDEIRLYHAGDQKRYEVFSIPSLANNLTEFERFYFLLSSKNLIPATTDKKESILDALYAKNRADEKEINAKFYASYSGIRDRLFSDLSKSNPGFDKLILLEKIQKILDRFIFLCFCEDKNFIGESTLGEQITKFILNAPKKIVGGSIWDQFTRISKSLVDGLDSPIRIPPYNGGLFEDDKELESLVVPNEALEYLNEIASYDFASTLDVNILGHIFEQSVSDIEEIKANIRNEEFDKTKGKRKRQGIYYTPSYITGFIIEKTVGAWIEREKEALGFPNLPVISEEEEKQLSDAEANPKTKLPKNLADKASLHAKAWLALQEKLKTIKILDPACGSGAFLNKAFEYLVDRHEEILSQRRHFGDKAGGIELEGGQRFDDFVAKNNLYGVDLSKESVEITKLSLWLRLVYHMEKLPALNHAIKYGDSIVDDPAYTKAPFCWDKEFPFKFDVVLGNPPYVRMEFLKEIKDYLQKNYSEVHSPRADLYTFFYAKALQLLNKNGFFGFITSSNFTKTEYGKPLRMFLKQNIDITEIVDFGTLQIWSGTASNLVCIFIAKEREIKLNNRITITKVDSLPKDENSSLEGFKTELLQESLNPESWNFDRQDIEALRKKIFGKGKPLKEIVDGKIYRGIVTGLNEAFIIDKATKDSLIKQNPKSAEIIKPFLQGKDLKQWHYEDNGRFIIYTYHGIDMAGQNAILNYLSQFREKLEARATKQEWYELQQPQQAYLSTFEDSKIIYPDICGFPHFSFDLKKSYLSNTCYFFNAPIWVLPILNSKVWWFEFYSTSAQLLNGFLRMFTKNLIQTTIVEPAGSEDDPSTPKGKLSTLAKLCQDAAFERHGIRKDFLEIVGDEVRQSMSADDRKKACPDEDDVSEGSAINRWDTLGWDEIVKVAQSPSAFGKPFKDYTKNPLNTLKLKKVYQQLAPQCHELTTRIHEAEREINQIVYSLYDLTPDEIRLLEEQTGNIYED